MFDFLRRLGMAGPEHCAYGHFQCVVCEQIFEVCSEGYHHTRGYRFRGGVPTCCSLECARFAYLVACRREDRDAMRGKKDRERSVPGPIQYDSDDPRGVAQRRATQREGQQ